jgi:hypothetical protein
MAFSGRARQLDQRLAPARTVLLDEGSRASRGSRSPSELVRPSWLGSIATASAGGRGPRRCVLGGTSRRPGRRCPSACPRHAASELPLAAAALEENEGRDRAAKARRGRGSGAIRSRRFLSRASGTFRGAAGSRMGGAGEPRACDPRPASQGTRKTGMITGRSLGQATPPSETPRGPYPPGAGLPRKDHDQPTIASNPPRPSPAAGGRSRGPRRTSGRPPC